MFVVRHVCVLLPQTLVTGAILSRGQDTTRSRKSSENNYGGCACFEMPWWGSLEVKYLFYIILKLIIFFVFFLLKENIILNNLNFNLYIIKYI